MKTTGIANWAYLTAPDTKFDPCWRITITLSEEEAKKLRDLGLKVKRDDETGSPIFKFVRRVERRNGSGNNAAPRVVDAYKNPLPDGVQIGNGSTVNVQFGVFEWTYKGKKGISADLQAVQALNLVPYVAGGSADEFVEETIINDSTNHYNNSSNYNNSDDDDEI